MSGNTLSGDPGAIERGKQAAERVNSRVQAPLMDRLEAYERNHDVTRSDIIRKALDEFLPSAEGPEYLVPKDAELAKAYRALARDEQRVITVEHAVDVLAEASHPSTPKMLIKSEILSQLEQAGFIGVRHGRMSVRPLTRPEEAAEEGELKR